MLKVKALILFLVGIVVLISDLIITPNEITYADRPILAFLGILFVSYIDLKVAKAKNHRSLRKIFYYSVIALFLLALMINILLNGPIFTFPFMVGCLLQTLIYLRALKMAQKVYGDQEIKIFEAPIPAVGYKIMSGLLFIRDLLINHKKLLESADIKEGDIILDYGCGPGAFTFAASKIVGDSGTVYALDNQHLAVQSIKKKAESRGINNIKTIYTNQGETGLDDKSVDHVLLIGVLHLIRNPEKVLGEIKRVMKDEARLLLVPVHIPLADLERMIFPMFKIKGRVNQMDILVKPDYG
jgi:SAM-dependent methyltransferase